MVETQEVTGFLPDVLSYNDYYPYGMLTPGRHGSDESYRYGFQGQEKDDELKGEGNSLNYTFRMHDPRVGRFFSRDPLSPKYPYYTPYQFAGNKVIAFKELEGLEELVANVVNDNNLPAIYTNTGSRLFIDKIVVTQILNEASTMAEDISYQIAYNKLSQGYLMGSNNKIYKKTSTRLVEEMIDGTVSKY